MAEEKLEFAELLQILQLIKSASQFEEVYLKFGEIEVHVTRGVPRIGTREDLPAGAPVVRGVSENSPPRQASPTAPAPAAAPAAPVKSTSEAEQTSPKAVFVRSPMVGTFYRAPAPEAPPFVEIGQIVEPGTTICIIEVMKLMSSIVAETRGTVTQILVNNAEMVEYDQVLMAIEPH